MKKLSLAVFFALFTLAVFAQPGKGYIYLKNGSVVKGKYFYTHDQSKLQVASGGNYWVFDATEVDSILSFRNHRMNSKYRMNNHMNDMAPRSFFMRTEIGVLAGSAENNREAPLSFSVSLNNYYHSLFSLGVGTGLETLQESYLPLFVNFEYRWRESYSTPYFFLKTGYMVPLGDANVVTPYHYEPWRSSIPNPKYYNDKVNAKGGFMVNPGVGYNQMFTPSLGMSFAFGYQFHRLQYRGEKDYGLDIDYNRITIKIGIIFN
ncbi:MAG: hypothetical protein CSA36_01910 [Draconibacterium sp.]|nr:MAG: hypothetical protein CSA36_01910 [Draconibacterium sp.]